MNSKTILKRIISFALSLLIACSLMQAFDAAGSDSAGAGSVRFGAVRVMAAENDSTAASTTAGSAAGTTVSTWNSSDWVRILRDYAEYTQVGNYYYYFTREPGNQTYHVYREDVGTGQRKEILKFKSYDSSSFYTNGKKLIYTDEKNGTTIKCKDLTTSKTKTIVNLTKYRTSRSTDTAAFIHIYGKYLYYSKYRGLSTNIYKLYRVNINTGKESVVKSGYIGGNPKEESIASGKYFLVAKKNGAKYVFNTKKKSVKKIGGSSIRSFNKINGYWYYVTCSKSGSKTKFKVYRKKETGKGKAKLLASFKAKFTEDDLMMLTDQGVFFMDGEKRSKEYRYAKKKFINHKEMDVWYYINRGMYYQ